MKQVLRILILAGLWTMVFKYECTNSRKTKKIVSAKYWRYVTRPFYTSAFLKKLKDCVLKHAVIYVIYCEGIGSNRTEQPPPAPTTILISVSFDFPVVGGYLVFLLKSQIS